jgi:hypothetical protein
MLEKDKFKTYIFYFKITENYLKDQTQKIWIIEFHPIFVASVFNAEDITLYKE